MLYKYFALTLSITIIALAVTNCSTLGLSARVQASDNEFMPTPDSMVSGRSGNLGLRYYTYKSANYKDWKRQFVILSFYSTDDRCWSLFEEYYMID